LMYCLVGDDAKKMNSNQYQVMALLQEYKQFIYPDIYEELHMSQSSFHYAAKQLLDSKTVDKFVDDNGKTWYQLANVKEGK